MFFQILKNILIVCLFGIFASCSRITTDTCGADEFVIDSYKIQKGKFAILKMQGIEPDELQSAYLEEEKDFIQNGDVLNIEIYHPSRLDLIASVKNIGVSIGFHVREGKIYLPDLGATEILGLTLEEAKEKIENRYKKEIDDIDVFISYKDRLVKKVELAGLVQLSSIPIDGKTRLFDVLSAAKPAANANFFKSYIVRDNKALSVDLNKLIKEGDMTQNIIMRGGDKIYIAESSSANLMVMGEVNKPTVIDLPTGYISIREALTKAGGIPYTGDKSYIQVIRGNIINPKIYILNWQHVLHLPNNSLLLMPGDIVYVASKPITEWNRFITQILPTIGIIDSATQGFKNLGLILNEAN